MIVEKLNIESPIHLVCNRCVNYDTNKVMYDAYFEEYRNDNKWHILHTLGKFETKRNAVQAAKNWLTIQKIKYHENNKNYD